MSRYQPGSSKPQLGSSSQHLSFGSQQESSPQLYSALNTPSSATVRDQFEQLESSLTHYQKVAEAQKKTHNELFLQIKHLQGQSAQLYAETLAKIDEAFEATHQSLAQQHKVTTADCELLEIQNHQLEDSHKLVGIKAKEIAAQCDSLVQKVGL